MIDGKKTRAVGPTPDLIAEFYLVDRGLRFRLPGFIFSSQMFPYSADEHVYPPPQPRIACLRLACIVSEAHMEYHFRCCRVLP